MARIGFEQSLYSVDEGAGRAVLAIAVISGTLSGDVIINFETTDATAQGTYIDPLKLIQTLLKNYRWSRLHFRGCSSDIQCN